MIVDSPGVDDMGEMVNKYLPEAFAFIYVIDCANAKGVQSVTVSADQLLFTSCKVLQSTRFMPERSTSNIHRLAHSSISFFEKFSDSLKLGFYIRNTISVIRNFFCNIVIIIQTFRTELKSFFSSVFWYVKRDIFYCFQARRKKRREHKADKNYP